MDRVARAARRERLIRHAQVVRRILTVAAGRLAQDDLGAHALAQTATERRDHEEDRGRAGHAERGPEHAQVGLRTGEAGEERGDRERDDLERGRGLLRRLALTQRFAQRGVGPRRVDLRRDRARGERRLRRDELDRRVEARVGDVDAIGERTVVDRERAGGQRDRVGQAQQVLDAGDQRRARRARGRARLLDELPRFQQPLAIGGGGDRVGLGGKRLCGPEREAQEQDAAQASRGRASVASCRSSASLRTRRSKYRTAMVAHWIGAHAMLARRLTPCCNAKRTT